MNFLSSCVLTSVSRHKRRPFSPSGWRQLPAEQPLTHRLLSITLGVGGFLQWLDIHSSAKDVRLEQEWLLSRLLSSFDQWLIHGKKRTDILFYVKSLTSLPVVKLLTIPRQLWAVYPTQPILDIPPSNIHTQSILPGWLAGMRRNPYRSLYPQSMVSIGIFLFIPARQFHPSGVSICFSISNLHF